MVKVRVKCPQCNRTGICNIDDETAKAKDLTDGELIEMICSDCESRPTGGATAVPGITMPLKDSPLDGLETVEELAKSVMDYHKKQLHTTGSCSPALLAIAGDKVHVCMLNSIMNDDKDRAKAIMQALLKKFKAEAYFLVSECWAGKDMTVMPSQDPKRKELLMVVAQKKGEQSISMSVGFKKIDDQVFFTGEPQINRHKTDEELTGRFVNMLDDNDADDNIGIIQA